MVLMITAALLLFALYLIYIGQWRVIVTFLFTVFVLAGLTQLFPVLLLLAVMWVYFNENRKEKTECTKNTSKRPLK